MKNILYILALSFILVACKAKEVPQEEPKLPEIGYSNLLDEDTKNEVKEVIAKYLDGESVERFIGQTSLYNSTIKTESLVQKGYGKLDTTEEKYDMGTIVETWGEKYPYFPGYNCRLTAFNLINKNLELNDTKSYDESLLFMDKEAIANSPEEYKLTEDNIDRFKTLFSAVATENTKDIKVHLANAQKYMQEQNIKFNLNGASLITVWFYDDVDGNKLFVGHTGVLFPVDGSYIFIEKISFEAPYQVLKFASKEDLNTYLMLKYEEKREEAVKPFIMENEELLKEYKTFYK